VTVSESEQLPEDGQVRPKHVAIDCDFNVILDYGEIMNILKSH
jgi:3-phosphoglycerate kinase